MFLKKKKKIFKKFSKGVPLVCITSYTVPIAKLADKYADIILVGDSVGPVLYGYESTQQVGSDLLINHAKAVVSCTKNSLIVVDMPYGTYEKDPEHAYYNAKKIIQLTGADAVKLEGGEKIFSNCKISHKKKINVMGHIGMLPQSTKGKYLIFGRKKREESQVLKDLTLLERAGVFSVVVECTVEQVVKKIVGIAKVPIIGIGATAQCHGQILVSEDLVGLTDFEPKFLKKYANIKMHISSAFQKFSDDV